MPYPSHTRSVSVHLAAACAMVALLLGGSLLAAPALAAGKAAKPAPAKPALVSIAIHGGAGTLSPSEMTPELAARYTAALEQARDAGYAILEKGGPALDAVEAAVRVLEDNELFNAARGAVFDADGRNSLDASIMDGSTLAAGAVTGVRHVRNPVTLARRVMERSPHVMLSGDGAEEFALEQGLKLEPASYFRTERRWKQFLDKRGAAIGPVANGDPRYFGTVGAVARDSAGHLAAATSTGGMTGKKWGRIGDSPIIGAGTYAEDGACAVSGTGHGEYFIRNVVGYQVCSLVKLKGVSIAEAARIVVQDKLKAQGGDGGIIAMGPNGDWALEFNSEGMYRAARDSSGRREVGIFR
jgi:beta-aspartyl-peptidase (threonine type)